MTKDEALKLALEALEEAHYKIEHKQDAKKREKAITAIKEALAQPEHGWTPERIVGMARLKDAQDKRLAQPDYKSTSDYQFMENVQGELELIKLVQTGVGIEQRAEEAYKAAKQRNWVGVSDEAAQQEPEYLAFIDTPQRTWVGLTLDERIELADDVDWPAGAYCEYAEKIEAKLKELNT